MTAGSKSITAQHANWAQHGGAGGLPQRLSSHTSKGGLGAMPAGKEGYESHDHEGEVGLMDDDLVSQLSSVLRHASVTALKAQRDDSLVTAFGARREGSVTAFTAGKWAVRTPSSAALKRTQSTLARPSLKSASDVTGIISCPQHSLDESEGPGTASPSHSFSTKLSQHFSQLQKQHKQSSAALLPRQSFILRSLGVKRGIRSLSSRLSSQPGQHDESAGDPVGILKMSQKDLDLDLQALKGLDLQACIALCRVGFEEEEDDPEPASASVPVITRSKSAPSSGAIRSLQARAPSTSALKVR